MNRSQLLGELERLRVEAAAARDSLGAMLSRVRTLKRLLPPETTEAGEGARAFPGEVPQDEGAGVPRW